METGIRPAIRRWIRKTTGLDVRVYDFKNAPMARRMALLQHHGIGVVLDVGANMGQYAQSLRRNGYRGRIVSFEPMAAAFQMLQAHAQADPAWEAVHFGLGAAEEEATIHIAQNPQCSSLLAPLPRYLEASPAPTLVGDEAIRIQPLDTVFSKYVREGERGFLKLDVQGYERRVLEGAQASLPHIAGVQLELSLVPLYEGGPVLEEMLAYLAGQGFTLMSIEPTASHPRTGQQLQVDGVFFREEEAGR
ncbi:MAG: FkbM family methyltransferase [Rhodothermales bacterium]